MSPRALPHGLGINSLMFARRRADLRMRSQDTYSMRGLPMVRYKRLWIVG
jgi:hypothetical protein